MSVKTTFILLAVIGCATLILGIALHIIGTRQSDAGSSKKSIGNTCLFTTGLCIIIAAILVILTTAALRHGLYDYELTVPQLITGLRYSPEEDTLPEDLSDSLIIYYRFTCDDCEEIYDDLRQSFLGYNNVYWISTRSEQGKALRKLYPVEQVPTGIYIDNENIPHRYLLMTRTDEATVLDTEVVDRLKDLMAQNTQ